MNCRKIQRLFDELAEGRLPEALAEQLRRHLTDCTDCRVAQQRAAHLRRLLALKRYEQPAPAYFSGFLDEFHSRLQAETASPASLWLRLKAQWRDFRMTPPVWTLRYGLVGAASVLLVAAIASWMIAYQTKPMVAERTATPVGQNVKVSDSPAGGSHWVAAQNGAPILASVARDTTTDATTHVVLVPAEARMKTSAPNYVLDHLVITPASYDGPRVDF